MDPIKKIITIFSLILIIILGGVGIRSFWLSRQNIYEEDGIKMVAKTQGRQFKIYQRAQFKDHFLTGVNLGATQPGSFPGELAVPKDTYLRWFAQIHDMHADVIRVYTTMMPEFYEALYEFNQTSDRPLYLMQGVWINEYDARDLGDAFGDDETLLKTFIQDTSDLIDVIHGQAELPFQYGFAHGTYTVDVSPYVIGWILGVEWDPMFVIGTNQTHVGMPVHQGTYVSNTSEAEPFEVFLARVADAVIAYEVEHYQFMRPLSFVNWLTTDHLTHPNEPDFREDMVSVNTEHLIQEDAFIAGLFASYHVYPYYPEFMNFSQTYREHIDKRGQVNPYKAYLLDLYTHLSVPVFVAEFGVPASRGKTHEAYHSGFNQGFLSEIEQGQMIAHMLEDIFDAQYAGGFVFAWQDEWFKRTWNTMDFDLPLRRPFWSNVQTNEQHFGLMAFDPGINQRKRYVDGDFSDWLESVPIINNDQITLHTAFDERYMYVYIHAPNFDFYQHELWIPMMTNRDQGNDHVVDTQITFSHHADFLIKIRGPHQSLMQVDPYYDPFYFLFHELLEMLPTDERFRQKNTGLFVNMYQALSAELFLPQDEVTIPFSKHHTGVLTYGNANPNHESYHSLADFYVREGHIELKIPWQLLNISDPSSKMMLSDFYRNRQFEHEPIEGLFIGAYYHHDPMVPYHIEMVATTWEGWEFPTWHERLKQSYDIVKEAFQQFSGSR